MLNRLLRVIADPSLIQYKAQSIFAKENLRRKYTSLARAQGFTRPYFLLSFDCDTELDYSVAEKVHYQLERIGIRPVYAVPGRLLEDGSSVYKSLASAGAKFINHGYDVHTIFDHSRKEYISTLFYHSLTQAEIVEDVRRGHKAIKDVLGLNADGFRAPHFGTFSSPTQIRFLHETLQSLGYKYSSSTTPVVGFKRGPAYIEKSGLLEFPVTGCFDEPLRVLDSWSFRYAVGRDVSEQDYVSQLACLAKYFVTERNPGFVNLYADPSQVYDWPEFFEALKPFSQIAVNSFDQLIKELKIE